MNQHATANYVQIIQAAARHKGIPDTLDEALEARLLARLAPWYERLKESHTRYEAGERLADAPYGAKQRTVVYLATPLSDDEREAAFALYVTLVRFITKQVYYWFRRFEEEIRVITLEDALAESVDVFYQSLAAFDPAKGLRLISFLHADLSNLLPDYMERHVEPADSLLDEFEPEAPVGDLEGVLAHLLDFDAWAERITEGDKELLLVWEYLSMEGETPEERQLKLL